MQQLFTVKFMRENCGCYNSSDYIDPYAKLRHCSFMADPESITLEKIIRSEIPLKDKYWFVCKKLATKSENQQIAIMVAEIVLPIYERRYPDNRAPREAIEAAKQYISGHISLDKLISKRADAYAAAAAAAWAAAAAAAWAAAAAAAWAAAAAADTPACIGFTDADINLQLQNYLLTFINTNSDDAKF